MGNVFKGNREVRFGCLGCGGPDSCLVVSVQFQKSVGNTV